MLEKLYKMINTDELATNPMETQEIQEAELDLIQGVMGAKARLTGEQAKIIEPSLLELKEKYKKAGFYAGFKTCIELILNLLKI